MKKYKGKKSIAVITARGGSKGVSRKNIRLLNGKPVLWYSLSAALKSRYLSKVVVSSEDGEILRAAGKYGGREVPLRRPKSLAKDTSPSAPVIEHAVKMVEKKMGEKFDNVILIQPSTPFIRAEDIDACIKKLVDTKCDTVVSVYEANDSHPLKMKKIVKGRLVQYVEGTKEHVWRRQDLPPVYKRNGGIYANTREMIMKYGYYHGSAGVCRAHIMSSERSVDINNMADFYLAEVIAKILRNKSRKNTKI